MPDQSLTAIKNVTIDEPFSRADFPHRPVMPGVLIIEAMAQACAILTFRSLGTLPNRESVYYFVGIDKARFKRPRWAAEDHLRIQASIQRKVRGIWQFEASAYVGDQLCTSAHLMCTYKDIDVIHPQAIVHPDARIGRDVTLGAFRSASEPVLKSALAHGSGRKW